MVNQQILRIIHFNDIYDLQPIHQKGGIVNFKYFLQSYLNPHTIVLFSGDVFSPSLISIIHQGQHMIKPLNSLHIDVACLGNHDFDFGIQKMKSLVAKTNFPWLLSNIYLKQTNKPILGQSSIIIIKNNIKIGIFAVSQQDWICTLPIQCQEDILYYDQIQIASKLCQHLKKQKCDMIIALTHSRKNVDIILAQNVPDIDLILGGHDHIEFKQKVNQSLIIKSGTNFQSFSVISVFYQSTQKSINIKSKFYVTPQLIEVLQTQNKDQQLNDYILQITQVYKQKIQQKIAYTQIQLQTRFNRIRVQQTNWGNLISDIYLQYLNSDCAIINSGNIRNNKLIKKGFITREIILNIIENIMVTIKLTGKQLHQGLQNGVSKYPEYEGRFPIVSNICFKFNPSRKSLNRIKKQDILIKGQLIDYQKDYIVGMTQFMSKGGDGYQVFKNGSYVVFPNNCQNNTYILDMFFNYNKSNHYCNNKSNIIKDVKEFNGKSYIIINPQIQNRIINFQQKP